MNAILSINPAITDGETATQAYARCLTSAPPKGAASAVPPTQTFAVDDEAEGIRSYLADGEVIEGSLRLKSGIRIAGTVTGRVHCDAGTVIIEKTGVVTGGVEGKDKIIVDGTVGSEEALECTDTSKASISTPGLLAVMGTGRVYGCYQYGRIATYDDATIEGMGKKLRA